MLQQVATGFPFALDLWLSQARIRQNRSADPTGALQCYHHAYEIYEQTQQTIAPEIFNNMSVLSLQVGKTSDAIKYANQCMASLEGTQMVGFAVNHLVKARSDRHDAVR